MKIIIKERILFWDVGLEYIYTSKSLKDDTGKKFFPSNFKSRNILLYPFHKAGYTIICCLLSLIYFTRCKCSVEKYQGNELPASSGYQDMESDNRQQRNSSQEKGYSNKDTGRILIYEGMIITQ